MKQLLFVLLVMTGLPLQAAEIKATVLYYRISEPGIDPYLSRLLLTDKFLRIDEGNAGDNFILFDRTARAVYSVVHSDRSVLDIPYRAVERKAPKKLTQESRTIRDDKTPLVDGKQPLYHELHVNGALCYSVVSVEKLLPDAVKLIGEYRQVMAGEHAKNMANTPVELQQPCELALHIFNPLWPLEKGLPIQEWDTQGKAQALLNYKTDEAVDDALFVLPQGYRHYQTNHGQ
jgi:hypothetical protein